MIKKIQRKFISIAMLSLLIVVIAIIACIDGAMYWRLNKNADSLLAYIAQNDGTIPRNTGMSTQGGKSKSYSFDLTEETPFSTRFFTVRYLSDGSTETNIDNIAAVTQEEALDYSSYVLNTGRTSGTYEQFRYGVSDTSDGKLVIFIDCRDEQDSISTFLSISVITGGVSLIVMFILVSIFSRRAIRPFVETMELQKRFITDAGHEIKTPLAIISANADVIELENGKSEWTDSIRHQVDQLNRLVHQLLNLSKLEQDTRLTEEMSDFSLTDSVRNAAETFRPLIVKNGRKLETDIEENVMIHGNREGIEMMLSVLLDNAVKYSADGEVPITLTVHKDSKNARIRVMNQCENEIPAEDLDKMFKRFYRLDRSRNRKTGGYGIGLSIAKAVAEVNKGSISAAMTEGRMICFTVCLALAGR